jgi:hypothetical protein
MIMPSLELLEDRDTPGVVFQLDTSGDPSGFIDDPGRRAALEVVLNEISSRLTDPTGVVATFALHTRAEDLAPGVLGEASPYHFGASGLPDAADAIFSTGVTSPAGVARVAWHELGHALGLHHTLPGVESAGRPATMTPYGTGHFGPYDWQSLRDEGWVVSQAPPSYSLGVAGHVKTFDADGAEALSFLPYPGYLGWVGVRTLAAEVRTAAPDGHGNLHQKSFDLRGNELSSTLAPGDLPPQPTEADTTDVGDGVLRVRNDYVFAPYPGYRGALT